MKVELFEPKLRETPLYYGDIIEIAFNEHSVTHSGQKAYYILTYSDNLVNLDGGVRYDGKCNSIAEIRKALDDDFNINAWRILSKDEYKIQIHKIMKGGN